MLLFHVAFSCPLELHLLQRIHQWELFYPDLLQLCDISPDLGDPICTPIVSEQMSLGLYKGDKGMFFLKTNPPHLCG